MTSLWTPPREHVWPAMSDSVNTSAGEVRGKRKDLRIKKRENMCVYYP